MLWRFLIRPLLFRLDPERAHRLSMRLFAAALAVPGVDSCVRRCCAPTDARLRVRRFGLDFTSPIGLAAGFDKDAEWFNALAALGFGFVEVGTLTAQPQPGNPRPRLFRLPADRALVNRFGFNNRGAAAAAADLARTPRRTVVGVNLGKSKAAPLDDAVVEYLASFDLLAPVADYVTVNVSSPNTPGLRDLQEADRLARLLDALTQRNRERGPKPLLLKIAPDLDDAHLDEIVGLCRVFRINGLVATNTTVRRDGLRTPPRRVEAVGAGGLSGAPLTERSREIVARLYRKTAGQIPIIGVGGILCGEDAWQMIRAGASLVQVYTGFIYGGPGFVAGLHRHLLRRLRQRGLDSLDAVVGEAVRSG